MPPGFQPSKTSHHLHSICYGPVRCRRANRAETKKLWGFCDRLVFLASGVHSGVATQYPYLAAAAKSFFISSGVGGAGRRLGSKGLLTSPKKSYIFDVVTRTIVAGGDEVLRHACLTFPGTATTAPAPAVVLRLVPSFDWKLSTEPPKHRKARGPRGYAAERPLPVAPFREGGRSRPQLPPVKPEFR